MLMNRQTFSNMGPSLTHRAQCYATILARVGMPVMLQVRTRNAERIQPHGSRSVHCARRLWERETTFLPSLDLGDQFRRNTFEPPVPSERLTPFIIFPYDVWGPEVGSV